MSTLLPVSDSTSVAGSQIANVRWKAATGGRLLWRFWDDEWVIFDSASGDTHVLSSWARQVMRFLESASANAAELAEQLSDMYEFVGGDRPIEQIERLLAELDDLGLIEACE